MAKYLLDTTVLIDFLRGRPAIVDAVKSMVRDGHQLSLCCINVAELYSRMSVGEQAAAASLVESLEYLDVSLAAARRAGNWRYGLARQGVTVATADAIVAATAYEHGTQLVTKNVRDFPMEGLGIVRQP